MCNARTYRAQKPADTVQGDHDELILCMQLNTKAIIRKVQCFMLPWLWLMVVRNLCPCAPHTLLRPNMYLLVIQHTRHGC